MKEKFIKSTIILLIGGLLTKLLGMIIKIILARLYGEEVLGLYMIILPTFILLINLSQFGFPLAISKLISENKRNNKELFISIIPIIILINILLILIILIFAPTISTKLLKNKDTYISIISISLVIPFTSISSICRSYFFGKEQMLPHVISNITEDIVRLLLICTITPLIINIHIKYKVCFLILINIISELSSTIILIIFLPKKLNIHKNDLRINKLYIKETLNIGIPNTTSKIIGSISYFLEPIILTNVLLKVGYSKNYIIKEYGILSGYIMPLILFPSCFTLAISQALLPVISKEYINGNIKNTKKKIIKAIILSLSIGIPSTFILIFKGDIFLYLIYKTNKGINYLKILAPFCILQYIEYPMSYSLDAINKSKDNLYTTIISTLVRTISLYLFSLFKIGIYGLIISIILNIIISTTYQIIKINKYL